MSQLGFAEGFLGAGVGRNARLEKIDALLDWSRIGQLLDDALTVEQGRPPYRPLSMFKALLLAQWYVLSDPGLEEALLDRLSFRRFCALPLDGETSDETTICRFRNRLVEAELADQVFAEINDQFEALGLIVKSGALIDATLVEASVREPDHRGIGGRPAGGANSASPLDKDANWGRGGAKRRVCFGYKAHIGVDQQPGLIRRRVMTPAATHDSHVGDALICGDERAVYADKAYEQIARREALKTARSKRPHHAPTKQASRSHLLAKVEEQADQAHPRAGRKYIRDMETALRISARQISRT